MVNKARFASAICALVVSLCALISLAIGFTIFALVFTALTVTSCAASAYLLYQQHSVVRHDNERRVAPTKKHTESISHAVEQHQASDADEKANKESATSVPEDMEASHRDDESGLLSANFFPVYLEQRITAARRTLRPVSLVIFELDGLDKNDSGAKSDRNFYISAVGDVVKRTLRESDCAFRIDDNIFAAVMDDTTESGAVWAAERVRGVLHTGALAGRVTVSAGVACYPSHVLEPEDLISSANKALGIAKARGVDQVEIAAEQ